MGNININFHVWNRFVVRNLDIAPSLLGCSHRFWYLGNQIEIKLPDEASFLENPNIPTKAVIHTWREVNGEKIPLCIRVDSVDVVIMTTEEISVPEEILSVPNNAYNLVPENQQKKFNELADKYKQVAENAYLYWVRVIRWKTKNCKISRPNFESVLSGWSSYLFEPTIKKDIWAGTQIFHIQKDFCLGNEVWEEIQTLLTLQLDPPIPIELLLDAEYSLQLGDLQRSTINMAMACEVFIRQLVIQRLPKEISPSIRKYLDEANIRQVINNFIPDLLTKNESKTWQKNVSSIQKLFNSRNEILHSGLKDGITNEECKRQLEAVKELFALQY